mgnify:CR=1 FL=1
MIFFSLRIAPTMTNNGHECKMYTVVGYDLIICCNVAGECGFIFFPSKFVVKKVTENFFTVLKI